MGKIIEQQNTLSSIFTYFREQKELKFAQLWDGEGEICHLREGFELEELISK